jgi:hypothetical protein
MEAIAHEPFNSPLKTADAFLPYYPSIELPPAAVTVKEEWELSPLCDRNSSRQTERVLDASALTTQLNTIVENLVQSEDVRAASPKRQKRAALQLGEFQTTVHQLDLRVRLAMMESLYQMSRLCQPQSSPPHHDTPSFQFLDVVQKLLPPPSTAFSSVANTTPPMPTLETDLPRDASPQGFSSPSCLAKTRFQDNTTPSPTFAQRSTHMLPLKPEALFTTTSSPEVFANSSIISPSIFFPPSQKRTFSAALGPDFNSVW